MKKKTCKFVILIKHLRNMFRVFHKKYFKKFDVNKIKKRLLSFRV